MFIDKEKSAVGTAIPATEKIEKSTDKSIAEKQQKSKREVYKSRVYAASFPL